MKTFSIENDTNNITIHASAAEAESVLNSERFVTEEELLSLAASWPGTRLVDTWNSLTGVTPVKKFQTRATAVSRIWRAIQSLEDALPPTAGDQPEAEPEAEATATAAPQTANAAPEEAPATNDASPETDAPAASGDEKLLRALARAFAGLTPEQQDEKWEALKAALAALPAETIKVEKTGAPREGSKVSQVIAMLKREGGATLEEIMAAMTWQVHTTRALLSAGGALAKKHGLVVTSEKVGDNRVYRIKA